MKDNTSQAFSFQPVFNHSRIASMCAVICWLVFSSVMAQGTTYIPPSTNRVHVNLDRAWKFHKGDISQAQFASLDDSKWPTANLPHTWNNLDGEDGGNNYYRGIGWYRKNCFVSNAYAGRKIFLQFGGANLIALVYVNGMYVGQHRGGYAAFSFDVTPFVAFGTENLIAVKVNNASNSSVPPLSGDFTMYGGIYRSIHLLVTDQIHISPLDYGSPGVYLKPSNVSNLSSNLRITAKLRNDSVSSNQVAVRALVVDASNIIVKTAVLTKTLAAKSSSDFVLNTTIVNPHLWNGRSDPYVYRTFVEVSDGSATVDLVEQPVGFRYFRVDPNNGFYLNGRYLDLHGVNRHQDRLNKGWAISDEQLETDLGLIKEIGATAVRLAHYQQAEHVYKYCDRNGLIIWTEVPLIDYIDTSTSFSDNATRQLRELIRQNYNHPSIFFWGLSNEITLKSGPDPSALIDQLALIAKSEDPTRLSTVASFGNVSHGSNRSSDVIGFNRYFGWYYSTFADFSGWADNFHAYYPTRSISISEFGAGASIHHHAANPTKPVTSGWFHPEEWQSLSHEQHWQAMKKRRWLWGKFVWNMFDFASENRDEGDTAGRNDKGLVTSDRATKKDAFYWYKANWSNSPLVYITSRRFAVRRASSTAVKIYSNCDSVELKVNGRSLGSLTSSNRIFRWPSVNLSLGENRIEAIGYKNGVSYRDSCTWSYSPLLNRVKINFQPVSVPVPDGHLADYGGTFGPRGNGFTYGWSLNNRRNTRDRNSLTSPNQRHDTLVHMQVNGNYRWEITVPNGTYAVHVAAGDPSYVNSKYEIAVEGVLVISGTPTNSQHWVKGTKTVTVSDGKLTINNATGAVNNKICFVEIMPVTG